MSIITREQQIKSYSFCLQVKMVKILDGPLGHYYVFIYYYYYPALGALNISFYSIITIQFSHIMAFMAALCVTPFS